MRTMMILSNTHSKAPLSPQKMERRDNRARTRRNERKDFKKI